MRQVEISDIEKFVDTESMDYWSWDKGDCSLIGILKLLLVQELKREAKDPWYQVEDPILKRLLERDG